MQSYCLSCKVKTAFDGEPSLSLTKTGRKFLKGKCESCGKTKSLFVSKNYGEDTPVVLKEEVKPKKVETKKPRAKKAEAKKE